MRASEMRSFSLLLLAAVGCGDGLGRELVDMRRAGDSTAECYQPAVCKAVPLDAPLLRDLRPSSAIAADCPSPDAQPLHVGSTAPSPAKCVRWRVPLAAGERLALRDVAATQLELFISATEPAELTFAASALSASRIVLDGPVTLRIVEQSTLTNVQIVSPRGTQPEVELSESNAQDLTIVNELGEAFFGQVRLTRADLARATLIAADLTLENVRLLSGAIASDRLVAHAIRAVDVKLQVGRAALASVEFERFAIERCGSLQITAGLFASGSFAPCGEPLRIDRSDVDDSAIVGRVEGRLTSWQAVSFGAGSATDLELWASAVRASALCEGMQRFAVEGEAKCNVCSSLPNAGALSCRIAAAHRAPTEGDAATARSDEPWANPGCPALDTAPACAPMPRDEYPF